MKEESSSKERFYYDQWKECRKIIARFDDYLLRLRTRTFAIFALLAGGLFTVERLKILNLSLTTNSAFFPVYFANLLFFSLITYLLLVFVLDRYYERLLFGSIAQSCILEIKMQHSLGGALLKQMEKFKGKVRKNENILIKIFKKGLRSHYQLVFLLYILMFSFVGLMHGFFLFEIKNRIMIYSFAILYVFYFIISFTANIPIFAAIRIINSYRRLFFARILFTREQIENRIFELSQEIVSNNIDKNINNEIVLISIMHGARTVASEFKRILNKTVPNINVREYPVHIQKMTDEKSTRSKIINFHCDEKLLKDQIVIIIDDFTDKGKTLQLVYDKIAPFSPKKLITFVVVKKRKSSETIFAPDYICFDLGYDSVEAKNKWLFGYGMDIDNEFRDCDYIAEHSVF